MPIGSGCLAVPAGASPRTDRLAVRPVAASTLLRPAFEGRDTSTGRVLAAFPSAVYVQLGGQVLALTASDGLRLPVAAVLAEPAAAARFAVHSSGDPVLVRDGALQVGPVRYAPGRWWSPGTVRPGAPDPTAVEALGAALAATAPAHDPAVERALAAAATQLRAALGSGDDQRAAAAADAVLGLGPGLTPSGDDLLAGLLVTCHGLQGVPGAASLGRHVARRAPARTTALSAALLACAVTGAAAPPALDLVDAVAGRRPLPPALRSMLAVGHTSGHDTARGVHLAALLLLDRSPDSPAGVPLLSGAPTEEDP
jgi:hypothetical protein